MTIELSDEMRSLLEWAGDLDSVARTSAGALAENDYVPALQALTLELAAVRATIEAAAIGAIEPPRFVGDQLVEVEAGWYEIELMGHRRRHGYVETVRLAGRQMVEIRVPHALVGADGEYTGQWSEVVERYAASAVFSLSESSEDDARDAAQDIPF